MTAKPHLGSRIGALKNRVNALEQLVRSQQDAIDALKKRLDAMDKPKSDERAVLNDVFDYRTFTPSPNGPFQK